MIKKLFLLIVLTFCLSNFVSAKELPVCITPENYYTTATNTLQVGDYVYFKAVADVKNNGITYVKKDDKIEGLITEITENGYLCSFATISVEQFKSSKYNFNGLIYVKGNEHKGISEYFLGWIPFVAYFVRGGEAHFKPNVDTFTIYLGV